MSGLDAIVTSSGGPVGDVSEIEVFESLGEPTRFRFRVAAPVADGDLPTLSNGAYDPGATVGVLASGTVLVRGPVTGQRIRFAGDSDSSYLDVLGGDRTLEMDREAVITSWSMLRASDAVTAIVATYQMVPDVESTSTMFTPLSHELVQRGTDFAFIRRLARQHGFLFWTSVSPIGVELAHFKSPPVTDGPATTLAVLLDGAAFDTLELEWDADRPTSVTASGLDLANLSTIDVAVPASPLPPMAGSNLAAVNGGQHSALALAPGDDAPTLTGPGNALLSEADLFVTASAATTVARAGMVLRAHSVVTLDGLGQRHSGVWLVSSVRHLIDAVSHRMECTFTRNGWEG